MLCICIASLLFKRTGRLEHDGQAACYSGVPVGLGTGRPGSNPQYAWGTIAQLELVHMAVGNIKRRDQKLSQAAWRKA